MRQGSRSMATGGHGNKFDCSSATLDKIKDTLLSKRNARGHPAGSQGIYYWNLSVILILIFHIRKANLN